MLAGIETAENDGFQCGRSGWKLKPTFKILANEVSALKEDRQCHGMALIPDRQGHGIALVPDRQRLDTRQTRPWHSIDTMF